MFNVLLVDDEPLIVESMYTMLEKTSQLELVLWKATSAAAALTLLKENRIDILITDVRMPGMNGIELAEQVQKHWRNCKVIFLSGYSDYEYLQAALRTEAFDYLLKPVDDETMMGAFLRAIGQIESELKKHEIIALTENRLLQARSLLQKQFIDRLLTSKVESLEQIALQLDELQMNMNPNEPLFLMISRVDKWLPPVLYKEDLFVQTAIQEIVEQYLNPVCSIHSFVESHYTVWFIQLPNPAPALTEDIQDIGRLQWYVNQLLDKIQQAIHHNLQVPVSFALSNSQIDWLQIHQSYKTMCGLLQRGIGLDKQIILVEQTDQLAEQEQFSGFTPQEIKRYINQLIHYWETGNEKSFHDALVQFFEKTRSVIYLEYSHQLEIFSYLTAMFLTFLNTLKPANAMDKQSLLPYLSDFNSHANWSAMEIFFYQLSDQLFSLVDVERQEQKKSITDRVDAYLIEHLKDDTSLSHLAKLFHLSPFYLSRLFHAERGISLSERIKSLKIVRAKELLAEEKIKIQEIAVELGFGNVPYFTKFFKKNAGVTPIEYRNNLIKQESI